MLSLWRWLDDLCWNCRWVPHRVQEWVERRYLRKVMASMPWPQCSEELGCDDDE